MQPGTKSTILNACTDAQTAITALGVAYAAIKAGMTTAAQEASEAELRNMANLYGIDRIHEAILGAMGTAGLGEVLKGRPGVIAKELARYQANVSDMMTHRMAGV